jgi:hypothetical protein
MHVPHNAPLNGRALNLKNTRRPAKRTRAQPGWHQSGADRSRGDEVKLDRHRTRELVRRISELDDPMAALALFEHSIACGHTKIALLRYLDARRLNAPLRAHHESYVDAVSTRLGEEQLRALVTQFWLRHHHDERTDEER